MKEEGGDGLFETFVKEVRGKLMISREEGGLPPCDILPLIIFKVSFLIDKSASL